MITNTMKKSKSHCILIALLMCSSIQVSNASVIVSYIRELSPAPGSGAILSLAQAPSVTPSDPLYDPDTATRHWISTADNDFYLFDTGTGVVAPRSGFPDAVKLDPGSLVALSGAGTAAPLLHLLGFRNTLIIVDVTSNVAVGSSNVPVGFATSLVTQGSRLNIIADGFGYSIHPDLDFGSVAGITAIFETDGGTALGEFSSQTLFQAYGANGLLHVLDYGNGRIQMLDPENSFAAVGQFALQTGVTTANFQFTIGSDGNIYLGDGEGGGSVYTEDGTFSGTFTLPGSVVGTLPIGLSKSYLSTDPNGGVYVFDSTGFHQYSTVPEPGAASILLFSGMLALAISRRRPHNPRQKKPNKTLYPTAGNAPI